MWKKSTFLQYMSLPVQITCMWADLEGDGRGIKSRCDCDTLRHGISTFVSAEPRSVFNEKWEHLAAMFE